jgi:hypothetical protein
MSHLRSPRRVVGAIVIATALVWGSGTIAAALPQTERLHAAVHSSRIVDYATDVAAPGSPFFRSRATYDQ